ncbi:MAG: amino acid ABC transporter substrate-binding protein [Actinobacteria bacterium]|nr:amino acid ABC transporter substrate-binding protein [Actinomycetota bacterium]
MRISKIKLPALLLAFGLVAAGCSDDGGDTDEETTESPDAGGQTEGEGAAGGDTLAAVQEAGTLKCGVNGVLAGFSLNEGGEYTGFDVDYCKAVAAAVLGDPEAVEYVELTADTRFTALQSGEVDVLIRNGTWTASRDGSLGLDWAHTTFYDGQGMMVMADSEFQSLDDMQNTVICVQSGTTTELNLATVFESRGITYEPLLLEDQEALTQQFEQGACDGYTTDKSGLASFKQTTSLGADAVRILDETMSKEPLGPAVRQGDSEWYDIVNWVVFATIQAEEFGLTSDNIASYDGDDPEILRFIGKGSGDDAQFDAGLNLPSDYAVQVVEAVGNYAEIYERNIAPLGLENRGLNALWTDGGLHYAPPYR